MPVEDLEDHHGAVHHFAADLLFEVVRLRGGDVVVDEDEVRALEQYLLAQLLALADPEVPRRIEAGALLREGADHLEPQRLGELAQLGQRGLELDVARAGQLYGHHEGALGCLVGFPHQRVARLRAAAVAPAVRCDLFSCRRPDTYLCSTLAISVW